MLALLIDCITLLAVIDVDDIVVVTVVVVVVVVVVVAVESTFEIAVFEGVDPVWSNVELL